MGLLVSLWLALSPALLAADVPAGEARPAAAQLSSEESALFQGKNDLLWRVEDWKVLLPESDEGNWKERLQDIKREAAQAKDLPALTEARVRLRELEAELRAMLIPGWAQMDDFQRQSAYLDLESKKLLLVSLQRTRVRLDARQKQRLDLVREQVRSAEAGDALSVLYDRLRLHGAGDSPIVPVKAVDELAGALEAWALPRAQLPKGLAAHGSMEVPSAPALSPADEAKAVRVAGQLGIPAGIVRVVVREAGRQGVDYRLVLAVIKAESGFNANATSPVGARGLMQIMPDTGRGLGVKDPGMLYDVTTNIRAGIRYLKGLWAQFTDFSWSHLQALNPFEQKKVKMAVAAYNAGPGAVQKHAGVPPYRETQDYVVKVLRNYVEYRRKFSE